HEAWRGAWSFRRTPRIPSDNGSSWEGLLRYDHFTPNTAATLAPAATSTTPGVITLNDQHQNRAIVGIAYWFPHQGSVSTAILLDYDGQRFDHINAAPVRSISLHGLLNFWETELHEHTSHARDRGHGGLRRPDR